MGFLDRFRRSSETASDTERRQSAGAARSWDPPAVRDQRPVARPSEARLKQGDAVSVSNEEHYQDVLRRLRGAGEYGTEVTATLTVRPDGNPHVKSSTTPVLEVLVDGATVGFLTPKMTNRYLPFFESASAEGRPLTSAATVIDGTGKGGRDLEITLNALPMWEGQTNIDGLQIETTVDFLLLYRTGRAHTVRETSDNGWVTACGQRVAATDGELILRTKPWVGRVRSDGTPHEEAPWWCANCNATDDDRRFNPEAGGRFGDQTGITRDRRFSSRMTAEAVQQALAIGLDFDVAGESHRDGYPGNLLRLAEVLHDMQARGEYLAAVLQRDPSNRFDANAIEVHVVGDAGHVGFVPAKLATILAPILDSGTVLSAHACEVRIHHESPHKPGLTVTLRTA